MKTSIWTLIALFLIPLNVFAAVEKFAVPMGESQWRVTGNKLWCHLHYQIPAYGSVMISQKHAAQPHFTMTAWRNITKPLQVQVIAKQPVWKRDRGSDTLGQSELYNGRPSLYLTPLATKKVLGRLHRGQLVRVQYHDDTDTKIKVDLSAVNFQGAYQRFTRCVGHLLSFPFAAVAHSTVHFGIDSAHVSPRARRQLARVKSYVAADSKVTRLEIKGYSDDLGRSGNNNFISQQRAKSVAQYLIKRGVPAKLIKTTWFGAKFPMADNDTQAGRAMNRRVSIRVIRD